MLKLYWSRSHTKRLETHIVRILHKPSFPSSYAVHPSAAFDHLMGYLSLLATVSDNNYCYSSKFYLNSSRLIIIAVITIMCIIATMDTGTNTSDWIIIYVANIYVRIYMCTIY